MLRITPSPINSSALYYTALCTIEVVFASCINSYPNTSFLNNGKKRFSTAKDITYLQVPKADWQPVEQWPVVEPQ
jgi:hypothetical protein